MADYSFDIVCKTDLQEIKNGVSTAMNEIKNRFDFKNSKSSIELDGETLVLVSDDDYKLEQVIDVLVSKMVKRGMSRKVFKFDGKREAASGNTVRLKVPMQNGLDPDQCKKITKLIKDSKLKVQVKIQGDQVRVSGKSRDDLQQVMSSIRESDFDFETQFVNYR